MLRMSTVIIQSEQHYEKTMSISKTKMFEYRSFTSAILNVKNISN